MNSSFNSAYEIYVQTAAEKTGKSEAQIRAELPPEMFVKRMLDLHHQWQCGDFSFGRFTELAGVPHWELWEILDALELPHLR